MIPAGVLTFATAFLGAAVESIEALTIVLAVGLTRGWRYALYGTVTALAVLALLVLLLGGLITSRVPESALRLIIGTLILLFGLRWLHKAVLRSAGRVPLHDEDAAYARTVRSLGGEPRAKRDWLGFTIAFKGVLLEGIEVAFIVFAVGASGHNPALAASGGLAAMMVVAAAGLVVRHPLARVPENTLKTAVGVMLASLGTFWAMEGMGVGWPLDFVSIPLIAAIFFAAARISVARARSRRPLAPGSA